MRVTALIVILSAWLSGAEAIAQDREPDGSLMADELATGVRLVPMLQLGIGGELGYAVTFEDAMGNVLSETRGTIDLRTTVGVGGRVEVPVGRHIAVGGLLHVGWFGVHWPNTNRDPVIDADALLKGMHLLAVGERTVELYGYAAVGFTGALIEAGVGSNETGWNLGLMTGVSFYVTDTVGVTAEAGFWHHSVDHGSGTPNQGRLHWGAVVRL